MKRITSILLALLLTASSLGAKDKVKNVILMIGDGMGISAVTAAYFQNGQPLEMQRAKNACFVTTYSASSRVTDSAAASTAIACSTKTYNGALGVDENKKPVESILTKASKAGFATGLIATHAITDATPGGFVAHVPSRKDMEDIAASFVDSGINLFIGGGRTYFTKRSDGRNLMTEMTAKGYKMTDKFEEVLAYNGPKVGALLASNKLKTMADGRGDLLPDATVKALELLKAASPKGFFIMVEGSMIDGGGHGNDATMIIAETLDFDKAVGKAFDFADKNPGTLVIVTADHETGGLGLSAAKNDDEGHSITPGLNYGFTTKGHTAVMVPLLAYGTGAQQFGGFMDNTDISKMIAKQLGIK